MLGIFTIVLIWLIVGCIGGEYIIRWNKRYLYDNFVNPHELVVAEKLNANLRLYRGTKVSVWRVILTLSGPITIQKAILLRLHSGRIK